jgi:hypothetical protein
MQKINVTDRRCLTLTGGYEDLSTAVDGVVLLVVPVAEATIERIEWSVDEAGSGGDGTSIMVNRVRAESDTEMLSAVSTIAHDATVTKATIDSTLQNNDLVYGDIVRIDLNVISVSTDATGLAIAVVLNVERD